MKSVSRRIASMHTAAAGTSTITPVFTSSPNATPSRRRLLRVSLTRLLTNSSSSSVVIMGKSIETFPSRPARRIAESA